MDRLPLLRQMAAARPDDPFPRYGLAMELVKRERGDEAEEVFRALIADHGGYVASYLMFGNLLVTRGKPTEAAQVLERGMEVAKAAGDDHSLGELTAARAELP